MTPKFVLAAAAATIAISFTATDAEAKRGGSTYKQWEFDSRHPIKGFEGFSGKPGTYCSYRREPERKCWLTRSGRERCKVVSWRLIQKCY